MAYEDEIRRALDAVEAAAYVAANVGADLDEVWARVEAGAEAGGNNRAYLEQARAEAAQVWPRAA